MGCIIVLGVAGHIIGAFRSSQTLKLTTKMVASTGFVLLGLLNHPFANVSTIIMLIGLVLCWMGDLFLELPGPRLFLIGLFSFLLGHAAFTLAFFLHGFPPQWFIAALLIQIITNGALYRWMQPHLPADMTQPVQAYIVVISLMVAFASAVAGAAHLYIILFAAILFAISDITVARQRFISPGTINTVLGIPLYYAAVSILALSISLMQ